MIVIGCPKEDMSCRVTFDGVKRIEYNPFGHIYTLIFNSSEICLDESVWQLYKPSMQKIYGGRYIRK